jgi:exodeoxyribonuclease VII small subunit
MKKETYKDFESALTALEQKVKALEEGNLPLDEALKVFEDGMGIADYCARKLHEAEQKVEILLKKPDGGMRKENFGDAAGEPAEDAATDEDVPF